MRITVFNVVAHGPGRLDATIEHGGVRQVIKFQRGDPMTWELTKEYSDLILEDLLTARALLGAVQDVEEGMAVTFPIELEVREPPEDE
jgi:hypothetical protein